MIPKTRYPVLLGGVMLAAMSFSPEPLCAGSDTAGAVTASTTTDALAKAPVVARRVVDLGDHTVTLVRIRRPNLPRPVRPEPVLSAADKEAMDRRANKAYTSLSLFATSYPGICTELTLRLDGLEVHAFSNVDFRQFSPISEIETEDAIYSWMGMIDEGDPSSLPAPLRAALAEGLDGAKADFAIVEAKGSRSTGDGIVEFLDAIHAYYALNKAKLAAAYRKRLADDATREAQLRANPPKPPNATLHYWVDTETPATR